MRQVLEKRNLTMAKSSTFIVVSIAIIVILFPTPTTGTTITLESLLTEMGDRDTLARWPAASYDSMQWSSYNRASTSPSEPNWLINGDGSGYLRTEVNDGRTEWVLAEQDGPGAITRLWTPYFYNNFNTRTGPTIRFYLDGSSEPVIADEMIGLLTGKSFVDSPFAYESVRAGDMYLPIPYADGMKITVDALPFYYHINSRAYESGTNVETFTQTNYQAATTALQQTGNALLNPTATSGRTTLSNAGTIQPGESLALSMPTGTGAVRNLQINLPTNQPEALQSTFLQIAFDGQETVNVPVGDLFSSRVQLNVFEDFARTVEADGTMSLRWVMPYQNSAQVKLVNQGDSSVAADVTATIGDWQWDDNSMYFHADWHAEEQIRTVQDWNYVEIEGKGVYVGDSLTVNNPVVGWWGEGDEKIYVDGETFPSHFGTGTEDYYGYAGGVLPDVATDIYSRPLHGQYQVACKEPGYNVLSRIRALDGIPFENQFKFDMEVFHLNNDPSIKMDYSVATFWYGAPGAVSVEPPPIDIIAEYRLGDNDPNATAGLPGNSLTIASVGTDASKMGGGITYDSNTAGSASSLSMKFSGETGAYCQGPAYDLGYDNWVMEAWVYSDDATNGGWALTNGNYILGQWEGNFLWHRTGEGDVANAPLIVNEWHHMALVRANGILTAYLDGVALTSTDRTDFWDHELGIGAQGWSGNELWKGNVDYVRLFNFTGEFDPQEHLILDMTAEPIPGDANGDGRVDGSDVTILAGNWQLGVSDPDTENITWEMGDFNRDGQIDGSDVTILAGNWQYGVTTAGAAVPEPSTIVLLLSIFASLTVIRRTPK